MASITASRVSASTQGDINSTHPYTCNSCQVAFRNSELQRAHMRSDWHRYNLKRRVTSLPPISSEIFTEKVLQAQASSTAEASKAAYEKTCTVCARTYFSENAYQNHLGSQKHKAKLSAVADKRDDETSSVMSSTFSLGEPTATNDTEEEEDDSDDEEKLNQAVEGMKQTSVSDVRSESRKHARPQQSVDTDEDREGSVATASSVTANGETVSLKRCLFCNYDSPSVPQNASHMERIHGMFIPEKAYLVDLDGLIGSLNEKIYEYHECLYCAKLKPSIFGLQTHMRDKGHCKIPFFTEEEQLEIGDFYDFSSTYSDVEEESDSEDDLPGKKNSGGVKLGAKRQVERADKDGDNGEGEGEGWETDSSTSSADPTDLTAAPLEHKAESNGMKHAHGAFYSDYELHLPSGRTAGHRSLNKYYRQNLHSHPSPAEREEQLAIEAAAGSESEEEEQDARVARRNERERGRALTSRANGGLGMVGVTNEKRKEVQLAEKRSRKVEERERRKFQWGNNKQGNFQKHFRDPLLQ